MESRCRGQRSECSRPPGGRRPSGGSWGVEADGIAAPAVEVLEVEAGVALTEEIASEPEAGRRREVGTVRQEVVADLGVGLTS